jgi:hypothetical protein
MSETDTFILHAGSDFREQIVWPDGRGGAANLVGSTVAATDVETSLAPLLLVTSPDLANGVIDFGFEWTATIKTGKRMHFRLRVTDASGHDDTTNRLWIEVT